MARDALNTYSVPFPLLKISHNAYTSVQADGYLRYKCNIAKSRECVDTCIIAEGGNQTNADYSIDFRSMFVNFVHQSMG